MDSIKDKMYQEEIGRLEARKEFKEKSEKRNSKLWIIYSVNNINWRFIMAV